MLKRSSTSFGRDYICSRVILLKRQIDIVFALIICKTNFFQNHIFVCVTKHTSVKRRPMWHFEKFEERRGNIF